MPEAPADMAAAVTGGGAALVEAPSSGGGGAPPPVSDRAPDASVPRNAPPGKHRNSQTEDEAMLKGLMDKEKARRGGNGRIPTKRVEEPQEVPEGEQEGFDDEGFADVPVGEEAPLAEEAAPEAPVEAPPAAPSKFRVGDREYTPEDIQKYEKSHSDIEYLNQMFRAYPGAREEVLNIFRNYQNPQLAKQPAAPQASSQEQMAEMLKGFPEELQGPLGKIMSHSMQRSDALEQQVKSLLQENAQMKAIQNNGIVDQEFEQLKGWAKQRGFPEPDRARVEAAVDELDGVPFDVAYKHAYMDEIVNKLKTGGGSSAAPKSGAPALARAGVPTNGAAKNGTAARAIPRPGSAPRLAPAAQVPVGKMSDRDFDQYGLKVLEAARKGRFR